MNKFISRIVGIFILDKASRRRARYTIENFGLFRLPRRAGALAPQIPERVRNSVVLQLNGGGLGDQFRQFAALWNVAPGLDVYIDVSKYLEASLNSFNPIDPRDLPRLMSQTYYRRLELLDYDILPFMKSRNIKFVSFPGCVAEYFYHSGALNWLRAVDGDSVINKPLLMNGCFLDIERPCKYRDEIRKVFKFRGETDKANREKLTEIRAAENSICMHIRRGDYIKHMHGKTIAAEYFSRALRDLHAKTNRYLNVKPDGRQTSVFIFSEDLHWARENIDFNLPDMSVDFVNINDSGHPALEIELMRNCKNYIISLGFFSQMAAFLNPENPTIIRPEEKDYCRA